MWTVCWDHSQSSSSILSRGAALIVHSSGAFLVWFLCSTGMISKHCLTSWSCFWLYSCGFWCHCLFLHCMWLHCPGMWTLLWCLICPLNGQFMLFSHNSTPWQNENLTQRCLYPVPVGTSLRMCRSYFLFHSDIALSRTFILEYWKLIRYHLLYLAVPTAYFYTHCILRFASVPLTTLFVVLDLTSSPYACIVNDWRT